MIVVVVAVAAANTMASARGLCATPGGVARNCLAILRHHPIRTKVDCGTRGQVEVVVVLVEEVAQAMAKNPVRCQKAVGVLVAVALAPPLPPRSFWEFCSSFFALLRQPKELHC